MLLAAASLLAPLHAAQTVWLSSLELGKVRQGWGEARKDTAVTQKPMTINGVRYEHGLGTHARSVIWVEMAPGSERFTAWVGVDDAAGNAKASMEFRVYGDNRRLWSSGRMTLGQPAKPVEVSLQGLKHLALIVTDAGDGVEFDHADWADARFEVKGEAPRLVNAPEEAAVILTPKPSPRPRVNGPRIFGVRPGNPFLYTIPATGEKPLKYAAMGLPEGLSVDATNGRISGRLAQPGRHEVFLRVSNARGADTQRFTIVCGDTLSLTPQMGWNSWYVWENHVTDKIMREAADAMVSSGLADHGFTYVNIDDCWARKPGSQDPDLSGDTRDAQGNLLTSKRFPDMRALTDYIHSKGLKAGTYISPGKLTCAGFTGSYGHEEQDARQFAAWGFDFLKYDWCSYGEIAKDNSRAELIKPYRQMGDLLRKLDRDVVFNLCQYGMGNVWEWGKEVGGHSWRTAGDLGGSFEGIGAALFRDGFDVYAANHLERFGGPGGWNDPDYLLVGYLSNWRGQTVPTPLTPNEQYTHISLWALLAAPLFLSGDITRLDDFTLSLLTNDEVLDVDQDALGQPARRVAKEGELEVWSRPLDDGSLAVGLFNRDEVTLPVTVNWADLGLKGAQRVRDLWRQKELGLHGERFTASVPRHGVTLVKVRK